MPDKSVEITNHVSENLKFVRYFHDLKQSDIGKICGASPASVSSWERKAAHPSVDKLLILCHHFDLDIGDFICKKLKAERKIITG